MAISNDKTASSLYYNGPLTICLALNVGLFLFCIVLYTQCEQFMSSAQNSYGLPVMGKMNMHYSTSGVQRNATKEHVRPTRVNV